MTISIRDLTVSYGRSIALDGVTLDVPEGSVFALLGRNGAGKSTLLKALIGLRRPDRGTIRVLGLDPWRERPDLFRRVAFTPESPDAPATLSVRVLAGFQARLHRGWDRTGFEDRIARFGIPPSKRFAALSRGQKGLVMLALALAQRAPLLVLDDPTLGLDPVARRFVFDEVIDELARHGTTILLATHDLEATERLATHIALLHSGRCRVVGELESLRGGIPGDPGSARSLEELFLAETQASAEVRS
jgi:ABC-2 type transport system ATP-binding protein